MPSANGTADVVRGHPDLVGRERKYAYYGGKKHLILDDVQIQGTAADGPETWVGQVSLVAPWCMLYIGRLLPLISFHNVYILDTLLQAS